MRPLAVLSLLVAAAVSLETTTPNVPRTPVIDPFASAFVKALPLNADYTALNHYGLKLRDIAKFIAGISSSSPRFTANSYSCKRLWLSLKADEQIAQLAEALRNHCRHNLLSIAHLGCAGILAQLTANATAEEMLQSGFFEPSQVATMACAVHKFVNTRHFPPPTSEMMGAAAFVRAFTAGHNQSLCLDREVEKSTCIGDYYSGQDFCNGPGARAGCCACGGGYRFEGERLKYEQLKDKTMVFIGGSQFSGTSIMKQILDSSPLVSTFHDTGVPEDEGQHLQDVFDDGPFIGGFEFGCHPEAYISPNSSLLSPASKRRLWLEWARWWNPFKSVLVEKSPTNIARLEFLQSMFADAKRTVFLILMKHPLAIWIAHALHEHKTVLEAYDQDRLRKHMHNFLQCWFNMYGRLRKPLHNLKEFRLIRLEEFMVDVQRGLADLESLLDLPPLNVTIDNRTLDRQALRFRYTPSHTRGAFELHRPAKAAHHRPLVPQRNLVLHGSRQSVSVETGLAFDWIPAWNQIQQTRRLWEKDPANHTRPDDSDWANQTLETKMAMMLTEDLLAELQKKCNPYGYNIRSPRVFDRITGYPVLSKGGEVVWGKGATTQSPSRQK